MQAYIGIDGGGSQTRFLAVDKIGNELAAIIIDRGSKPNHYGVPTAVEVIKTGLEKIKNELAKDSHSIAAIYAGISGCAKKDSVYQPIENLLSEFSNKYQLGGDILTNFRSSADSKSGTILLAGTGSAIANFYPSGRSTILGSLCHGAKDVIYELIVRYKSDNMGPDLKTRMLEVFGEELLEMNELEILNNQINTDGLIELNKESLSINNWDEYKQVIDRVGDRWVYKACGRIAAQIIRNEKEPIEVVMSGGLWKFEYLRNYVISGLEKNFSTNIKILYNPDRSAVEGATILAREL